MATLRQRKAVNNLVKTNGVVSKAMLAAGYAPSVANQPAVLTQSKAFKELMEEAGLTDDLLLNALVDDIKGKPKRRFKELELGFRVRSRLTPDGMEAPKGTTITNFTQIVINQPHGRADTPDQPNA